MSLIKLEDNGLHLTQNKPNQKTAAAVSLWIQVFMHVALLDTQVSDVSTVDFASTMFSSVSLSTIFPVLHITPVHYVMVYKEGASVLV